MTDDPITAVLQQLADHHDQLTQLTELVTGIGDTLREHEAALAELTQTPPADADGYQPSPPPPWWKLAADERQEPIARLPRAWKNPTYRRARRLGQLPAEPAADSTPYPVFVPSPRDIPDHVPAEWTPGNGTSHPWN